MSDASRPSRRQLDAASRERIVDSARRCGLRLSGAIHSLRTYRFDHPSLDSSYRGIADSLSDIHDLLGSVELQFDPEGVTIDGEVATIDPIQHPSFRELIPWLRRRGGNSLRVSGPLSPEQVRLFIEKAVFVDAFGPVEAMETINRGLGEGGAGNLQLRNTGSTPESAGESTDHAEVLVQAYLDLASATDELLTQGARPGTLNAVGRACEQLVRAITTSPQALPALLTLGTSLTYEARHASNTTVIAVGIGLRLGMPQAAIIDLARAVATMDVGQTLLPVEVRRAGREFSPSEQALLQLHPIESVRAHLGERGSDLSIRRRLLVAMEHHLGIHRDGYPEVNYWPRQHLFSRIASVCDSYDALTSTTAWRRGLAPAQALAQLASAGGRTHDQAIIAELCALVREYPEACAVRLTTGQLAAIIKSRGTEGLPVVRLLGADGAGAILDLGQRDATGTLGPGIAEILLNERISAP